MSLAELKAQALTLAEAEQPELVTFLAERLRRDSRQKIDEGWAQAQAGQTRDPQEVRTRLEERKRAWNSGKSD